METPYIIKTRRKCLVAAGINAEITAYVVVSDEPIAEGDFFVHQQIKPMETMAIMDEWIKSGKAYPQPELIVGWGTEQVQEAQVFYIHPASIQAGKPEMQIGWCHKTDKPAKELLAERGYPMYGAKLKHCKKVHAVLNLFKDTFETFNDNPNPELYKELIEAYRYSERGITLGETIGAL